MRYRVHGYAVLIGMREKLLEIGVGWLGCNFRLKALTIIERGRLLLWQISQIFQVRVRLLGQKYIRR